MFQFKRRAGAKYLVPKRFCAWALLEQAGTDDIVVLWQIPREAMTEHATYGFFPLTSCCCLLYDTAVPKYLPPRINSRCNMHDYICGCRIDESYIHNLFSGQIGIGKPFHAKNQDKANSEKHAPTSID
jgi:hypothetical protein